MNYNRWVQLYYQDLYNLQYNFHGKVYILRCDRIFRPDIRWHKKARLWYVYKHHKSRPLVQNMLIYILDDTFGIVVLKPCKGQGLDHKRQHIRFQQNKLEK